MHHSKFDKKVRFSYFIPYGVISPLALELSIPAGDLCYTDFHPTVSMDERIAACKRDHIYRLDKIKAMEQAGYIEIVERKIGKKKHDTIRVARLTKPGLYLLTGTLDEAVEQKRLELTAPGTDLYDPRNTYLNCQSDYLNRMQALNILSQERTGIDKLDKEVILEIDRAIFDNTVSILASEMNQARNVSLNVAINAETLNRNWRLSNINAFFLMNEFNSVLDQHPMINSRPRYNLYSNVHICSSLPVFIDSVLSRFYERYPRFLKFHDTDVSDQNKSVQWYYAPSFYPYDHIPGFEPQYIKNDHVMVDPELHNMGRTFLGLAAGKHVNYICYHTKPSGFRWQYGIEQGTMNRVKNCIEKANALDPNPHASKPFEFALMFCPTIYQFKQIFEGIRNMRRKRSNFIHPYLGMYIIPLNHGGAIQFRNLMLNNPGLLEEHYAYSFIQKYPGFSKSPNSRYPLSYKNTPVLLAHTMNFSKLYTAMEDYEDGLRFYVSCYPEQVKFIRAIMPNVEFI